MATSRSFDAFARRMAIRSKVFAKGVEKKIKRAAVAADTALVTTTPRDTGRAKGNWVASIGQPQEIVFHEDDFPSDAEAQSDAQSVISSWKLGRGPIFITNSLPYIIPLNEGSSAQAPNGMTDAAIQAAQAQLRSGKILR